ncbi:MAG: metal-dependent hydrolase [Pseudochelatococcus sp.]|jgi:L-ascorbate metabolism protein UlaG (beta-lactamase superfamily)|uniref:metal-dependent hydrolase n=1 Tax=Pseudochelatococcus sp. TaxID=2020869 RepID=UPI003D8F757E
MKITWFGHSAFRLDFSDKVVLIDPYLTGNPAFTGDKAEAVRGVTHILVTHGHGDHYGDTVAIAAETGATVATNADLASWFAHKGVKRLEPMNTGGSIDAGGFSVTLVRADHSAAAIEDGMSQALGNANGIVVKAAGEPTVYHLGDTDIFSDMALIAEIHAPDIAFVPIGDRFTMGAQTASLAVRRFLKTERVVPIHYATFPLLAPNAEHFVAALDGAPTQVIVPEKNSAFDL